MKKSILISIVFLLSTIIYGQQGHNGNLEDINSKSDFRFSVAPTYNIARIYKPITGGPGVSNNKPGFSTSIEYLFRSDKTINLGFGFSYQFAQVEYIPNFFNSGEGFTGQIDNISLISINYSTIIKSKQDFYLSLNTMATLQINYNSEFITDNQSGLGLSFSVGKYFKINERLRLNIEPKLWIHKIVPFQDERLPIRLTTLGLNTGLVF